MRWIAGFYRGLGYTTNVIAELWKLRIKLLYPDIIYDKFILVNVIVFCIIYFFLLTSTVILF